MYAIIYADDVVYKNIPTTLEPWKSEIKQAIAAKLMTRPEVYSRPLR